MNGTLAIHQDQVSTLIDKSSPRGITPFPVPHDKPQTPFESSLKLSREQEERLVEHCLRRIDELETEFSRHTEGLGSTVDNSLVESNAALSALGLRSRHEEWLTKRQRYYNRFYNHLEDRVVPNTIYADSNLTASLSQRICFQMKGRMAKDFFAGEPWFAVAPVGDDDQQLAFELDKFLQFKHGKSKLRQNLLKAIDLAFILGEAVVKPTFRDHKVTFQRTGDILVMPGGQAVFDTNGDYIFSDSIWIDEMVPVQQDTEQQPVLAPTGRKVLRRDNHVILPPQAGWERRNVVMTQTIFRGADSEVVHFKDFLCPLMADDIHKADICVHFYDRPLMEVAHMLLASNPQAFQRQPEVVNDIKKALAFLDRSRLGSSQYSTGSNSADSQFGENGGYISSGEDNALAEIAECYVRFDANEDGVQEEICIMIDRKSKSPIFYDYTQNVTIDGRRPFVVVRGLPRHNRWHGVGAIEWLEPEQDAIDLFLNRLNMACSRASTVTFWDPSKTVEGQDNPNLELGMGKTYKLKAGVKNIDEVLHQVRLYDRDREESQRLMIEMFIQFMQLKSGVVMSADEAVSSAESTKLATGIRSLERSGGEIFQSWVEEIGDGLGQVLDKASMIEVARLDKQEVFTFNDGRQSHLITIDPYRIKDLELSAKLLLTKAENERMLVAAQQGMEISANYYQQPLPVQEHLAEMCRSALAALGFKNADSTIQPTDLTAYGMGMLPGSAADPVAEAAPKKQTALI